MSTISRLKWANLNFSRNLLRLVQSKRSQTIPYSLYFESHCPAKLCNKRCSIRRRKFTYKNFQSVVKLAATDSTEKGILFKWKRAAFQISKPFSLSYTRMCAAKLYSKLEKAARTALWFLAKLFFFSPRKVGTSKSIV